MDNYDSMTGFHNVYEDEQRARAYAGLDYPGTYYLAFRDIPQLLRKHVRGSRALDFGCGAGRSTRFLRDLGFDVVGIDVSEPMLREARSRDPEGRYLLSRDNFDVLSGQLYDLVFCAFPFDNIPGADRVRLFGQLADLLAPDGRIVNLVSAADIYVNEWLSFSTRDFPENRRAKSGDVVRIVMRDVADQRPVEDIFSTDADYAETFSAAILEIVELHRPLGNDYDGVGWVSEQTVSPWTIHVLRKTRQLPVG